MSNKHSRTKEEPFDENKLIEFQLSETALSMSSAICMNVIGNLVLFSEILPIFKDPFSKCKVLMMLLTVAVFFASLITCFFLYKVQNKSYDANSIYNFKNLAILQSSFVTAVICWHAVLLLYKSTGMFTNGTCKNEFNSHDPSSCDLIPTYYIMMGLVFPLMCKIYYKGLKLVVIIFSSCFMLFTLGYIVLQTTSTDHIFTLFFLAPIANMLMFELRRQDIAVYKLNQSLKLVIQDNEAMADEMRLNEMKMMIGNVAHDLNTVRDFVFMFIFY